MKLKKNLVYVHKDYDLTDDIRKAIKTSEENYQKLRELSISAMAYHPFLGNYFRLQIADGYAYYQVIEFNKTKEKYLCVLCKGICLDEWQDNYIGENRWVDAEYVEHQINSRISFETIFSKK